MRRKQSTYTAKFNPENPGDWVNGIPEFRDWKNARDPGINSIPLNHKTTSLLGYPKVIHNI